jgi:hypothetical protein
MKFMIVSEERFYQKYRQHVQQRDYEFVNWFVDSNNFLNAFIMTDYSYGYFFKCNANDIPEKIKQMISKQGEFFGFQELETNTIIQPTFNEVSNINNILKY